MQNKNLFKFKAFIILNIFLCQTVAVALPENTNHYLAIDGKNQLNEERVLETAYLVGMGLEGVLSLIREASGNQQRLNQLLLERHSNRQDQPNFFNFVHSVVQTRDRALVAMEDGAVFTLPISIRSPSEPNGDGLSAVEVYDRQEARDYRLGDGVHELSDRARNLEQRLYEVSTQLNWVSDFGIDLNNPDTQFLVLLGRHVEGSNTPPDITYIYNKIQKVKDYLKLLSPQLRVIAIPLNVSNEEIQETFQAIKEHPRVRLLSVTQPHKATVGHWVDSWDPRVKPMRTTNHVLIHRASDGGFKRAAATNSDALAFVRMYEDVWGYRELEEAWGSEGSKKGTFLDKNVVILGGWGGLGQALTTQILKEGSKHIALSVTERRFVAAQEEVGRLRTELEGFMESVPPVRVLQSNNPELSEFIKNADVLINATPVGMDEDVIPLIEPSVLAENRNLEVIDTIYRTAEGRLRLVTPLLQYAWDSGIRRVFNGYRFNLRLKSIETVWVLEEWLRSADKLGDIAFDKRLLEREIFESLGRKTHSKIGPIDARDVLLASAGDGLDRARNEVIGNDLAVGDGVTLQEAIEKIIDNYDEEEMWPLDYAETIELLLSDPILRPYVEFNADPVVQNPSQHATATGNFSYIITQHGSSIFHKVSSGWVEANVMSIREAQALAQLQGIDNIVELLKIGVNQNSNIWLRLVAEPFAGNLGGSTWRFLTSLQKTKALIDITKAVRDINRKGWLHGDLKKENVLIGSVNHKIRLADFGLARTTHRKQADAVGLHYLLKGLLPSLESENHDLSVLVSQIIGFGDDVNVDTVVRLFEEMAARSAETGDGLTQRVDRNVLVGDGAEDEEGLSNTRREFLKTAALAVVAPAVSQAKPVVKMFSPGQGGTLIQDDVSRDESRQRWQYLMEKVNEWEAQLLDGRMTFLDLTEALRRVAKGINGPMRKMHQERQAFQRRVIKLLVRIALDRWYVLDVPFGDEEDRDWLAQRIASEIRIDIDSVVDRAMTGTSNRWSSLESPPSTEQVPAQIIAGPALGIDAHRLNTVPVSGDGLSEIGDGVQEQLDSSSEGDGMNRATKHESLVTDPELQVMQDAGDVSFTLVVAHDSELMLPHLLLPSGRQLIGIRLLSFNERGATRILDPAKTKVHVAYQDWATDGSVDLKKLNGKVNELIGRRVLVLVKPDFMNVSPDPAHYTEIIDESVFTAIGEIHERYLKRAGLRLEEHFTPIQREILARLLEGAA